MQLLDLGVQFDETTHSYITIHGNKMPSVTHIMRFLSKELYMGIPQEILAEAADRGTRVHKFTEDIDEFGWAEGDEAVNGYLDAYQRFLADFKPQWIDAEWRGYHKALMYAGTLDRIGYIEPPDDKGVDLVDLKTTRTFHGVMIGTQVDAYAQILISHGIPVRECYGLQLLPDGRYVFQRVPRNFKTFLHCLALHNAMAEEVKP